MPETPPGAPRPDPAPAGTAAGLWRASLVLLAGGTLAQLLPLLLGPWLTRLYTPQEFGHYHLFAAVAATLAVAACGRYEFALPMAADEGQAHALRRLCLRLLAAATLLSALGGLGWMAAGGPPWAAALPVAVAALGTVSLATLWANRAQRFRALAGARVLQHGGGALAQAAAGWAGAGVGGLVAGPLVAAAATVAALRLPWGQGPAGQPGLRDVARRHRDFPLWNTPHAFAGALQDAVAVALVAAWAGPAAAGFWGLALRYLKAPATLVGSAVSQALYPRLGGAGPTVASRQAVRRVMGLLALLALPLVALLWVAAPWAFAVAFGEDWRGAGELARALALYIGLHFVASPLGVVTMAWQAQRWALSVALVGQAVFVAALAGGLWAGGLAGAGWAVSVAMAAYFGAYFWRLATWPVPAPGAVEQSRP
ncbi:oligosaccharide flippase family protein [Ideonella sp.]|uniref:oligosaccharide flippase family protein n=1 Tax=Ideonella sp. TaxID=1929293 RepID=UPI0035AF47C6